VPQQGLVGRLLGDARVLGGAVVAAVAVVAFASAQGLEFGSLAEIGPGLFPVALAALLFALSMVLIVTGFLKSGLPDSFSGKMAGRALLAIMAALVVFALTIKGTGLTPALGVTGATPLAILIAGFASPETRWRDLVIFAILLTASCAVLFRFLLGLPLPLAPWILGY
jgi:Tripartite tricarboxylate transporter TctB family